MLALRTLAVRHQALSAEITTLDGELSGWRPGQLLAWSRCSASAPTALGRCWSPPVTTPTGCARKAPLRCCAAPPRWRRPRADHGPPAQPGGDRQANAALHRIVIVRVRWHQPTKDYMARRIAEGKTHQGGHPLPQAPRRPRSVRSPQTARPGRHQGCLTSIDKEHQPGRAGVGCAQGVAGQQPDLDHPGPRPPSACLLPPAHHRADAGDRRAVQLTLAARGLYAELQGGGLASTMTSVRRRPVAPVAGTRHGDDRG